MDFTSLINFLDAEQIKYKTNVKIALFVSIRVGGIASFIVYPNTIEQLCTLIKYLHGKYKYFILANGTNTYFCDYYEGVIVLTKNINNVYLSQNKIIAECGASLTGCAVYAYENSLSGMEFAYGIPGTVGGGIYMNASAYNGKISDIVQSCLVYDIIKNSTYLLENKEIKFSDKYSIFTNKELVILNAKLNLNFDIKNSIKEKMNTYMQKRLLTQPLDVPSAGSAFKRPKGNYASKLIDDAGLKGCCFGDAQISYKHAGFIVNNGHATSDDINKLICLVKSEVKNKFNVILEEEIIYVE